MGSTNTNMVRVGIVGFGHLGQYLVQQVEASPHLELAWVWNRTELTGRVEDRLILRDLADCSQGSPDIIVEVAHPDITHKYGDTFLQVCDFMIGSPTALADRTLEDKLRCAASAYGLYVPCGALWGGEDIRRMAERGSLCGLTITMKKPPQSFKLVGELAEKNDKVSADPALQDWHVVEVDVSGPLGPGGNKFSVRTVRSNPASVGAVTGSATYGSFLSSLLRVGGKGPGFHLC